MYDAILVLGGGVRENFELPEWSVRRFDLALELRHSEPIVCLSAGTTHRPIPLDRHGLPMYESLAGAAYLQARGMSPAHILVETASWDTVGNAYFSRVLFADPLEWTKHLIVTSEFHLPRTEALFRWVYGMDRVGTELTFLGASDAGLDLQTRREREERSLDNFSRGLRQEVQDWSRLHRWIYSRHDAYSASGRSGMLREKDPGVLNTY